MDNSFQHSLIAQVKSHPILFQLMKTSEQKSLSMLRKKKIREKKLLLHKHKLTDKTLVLNNKREDKAEPNT